MTLIPENRSNWIVKPLVLVDSDPLPVPCRPTEVQASLQCHSNSAAVSWEGSSGAQSYLVVGVAEDGSHQVECNSTSTHCDLSHLQCGQKYNISVFGLDESCSSVESDKAYMRTGNVNKKQPRYDNKYCIHLEEYIPPPHSLCQLLVHHRMWMLFPSVPMAPWSCPGPKTRTRNTSKSLQ